MNRLLEIDLECPEYSDDIQFLSMINAVREVDDYVRD